MSIIVQHDASIHSFIIFSADSSTCFGWYPHPSKGAPSNCNYNIWHWLNHICYRPLTWRSRNSVPTPPSQRTVANTFQPVPDVVITVWGCSCWWMSVSSETCRAVCRKYNKTVYGRIVLDNYWHWFTTHGPRNIKKKIRCSVWTVLYRVSYVDSNVWLHDSPFSHRSYHRPNRVTFPSSERYLCC